MISNRCWYHAIPLSLILWAIIGGLLVGCTTPTPVEGKSGLLSGIKEYRSDPKIEIVYHDNYMETHVACLAEMPALQAASSVLSLHMACAKVPFNPEGTCKIHVVKGDQKNLDHELLHCKGLDHWYGTEEKFHDHTKQ